MLPAFLATAAAALQTPPTALPLLLPDPDNRNKLKLQPEGVHYLATLPGPVSVVSTIGQYRSGKSFLLNQLMELPCEAGFRVGHQRETQTKGVWVLSRHTGWSQDNVTTVFLDTEGFDGTGRAAVYDDRIFAFSALIASALVYNLVETIREADIDKLSFAAQLAEEFWRRAGSDGESGGGGGSSGSGGGGAKASSLHEWRPPAMLWLVQRDFLQGGSVEEYLREALKPVAAPPGDEHAAQLNTIREVLGKFKNMRGLGLPQPHDQRTSLCEIEAHKFSPEYRAGLGRVERWLAQHTTPSQAGDRIRTAGGHGWLHGAELSQVVAQVVNALNEHDIPTPGSVIDSFNRDVRDRAVEQLRSALAALPLPLPTAALGAGTAAALDAALATLHRRSFGSETEAVDKDFEAQAQPAIRAATDANFRASHHVCGGLWKSCSASLAALKTVSLPSKRRFHARLASCNATMAACVGPAAGGYVQMMADAAAEGASEYGAQFYSKLSHMLVLCCAVGVLTFRYVYVSGLAELVCWFVLVGAEVLPRLSALTQFSDVSAPFWESPNGQKFIEAYEAAVYNEYADAEDWLYVLLVIAAALLAWRCCCKCRERCCGSKKRRRRYRRVRRRGAGGSEVGDDDEIEYLDDDWDEEEEEEMMRTPRSSRAPPRRGLERGSHQF